MSGWTVTLLENSKYWNLRHEKSWTIVRSESTLPHHFNQTPPYNKKYGGGQHCVGRKHCEWTWRPGAIARAHIVTCMEVSFYDASFQHPTFSADYFEENSFAIIRNEYVDGLCNRTKMGCPCQYLPLLILTRSCPVYRNQLIDTWFVSLIGKPENEAFNNGLI